MAFLKRWGKKAEKKQREEPGAHQEQPQDPSSLTTEANHSVSYEHTYKKYILLLLFSSEIKIIYIFYLCVAAGQSPTPSGSLTTAPSSGEGSIFSGLTFSSTTHHTTGIFSSQRHSMKQKVLVCLLLRTDIQDVAAEAGTSSGFSFLDQSTVLHVWLLVNCCDYTVLTSLQLPLILVNLKQSRHHLLSSLLLETSNSLWLLRLRALKTHRVALGFFQSHLLPLLARDRQAKNNS